MVLYRITLVPSERILKDTEPTLLSPFYTNDATFYGFERHSVAQLKLLMDWGEDRGYFPKLAKSLFIADNPEEEAVARQEFYRAVLNLNCLG